ncbi:MAG TPA: S26 family signal peptidase [Alcanivorax sp.]|nr:S26 family signal peptidase [Alcanivorax sp.]
MRPTTSKNLYALAGFFVPGLGHIAQGHFLASLLFLVASITLVLAIAATGLLHSPFGLEGMIIGLAAIHCLSAGTCYRVTAKRRHSPASATLFFVGFLFLTCTVYLGLFFNRTTLLGADLYRVTSDSMLPTLKPGDYILVDTRKYHNSPLTPGAIITFRSPLNENDQVMVKRISNIDTNTLPERLFVLGDNAEHSFDSRTYGWLDKSRVTGSVTRIFRPPLL